jgi:hypothetical protein
MTENWDNFNDPAERRREMEERTKRKDHEGHEPPAKNPRQEEWEKEQREKESDDKDR